MATTDIGSSLSKIRELFQDVIKSVLQFQQTRSDRYTRNLARSLRNEEVLYGNFLCQLFLLSPPSLKEQAGKTFRDIERRLDRATVESLKDDLCEMESFLSGLKADLFITGRGSVCNWRSVLRIF